jgi:Tfp pilus assembly protein PilF
MEIRVIVKMLILSVLVVLVVSCTTSEKEEKIPVTTESESARMLYDKADAFFEKVYIPQAVDLLEGALAEDPNFFMAAYGLATHHIYQEDKGAFIKYSEQAVQSELSLSKGEELLKAALQKLLVDQNANVTESGKELIKLYPNDPDAYFHLAFFQERIGDYQGHVETLLKAAEIKEDPANIFNSLGYSYMDMEQFNEAEKALDKYLELKPEEPNPYDSKGDYYMAIEEYGKAYESYMKAFEIDSTWTGSLRKARRASAFINSLKKE